MFKVGVLNQYTKYDEDTEQIFENRFEGNCEFYHLNGDKVANQLSVLDGLIMHYDEAKEKSILYEQIVIIRNISVTIPIWVVSERMSTIERLTFLKLHTFVVIKKFIFDEELSLTVSNMLEVFNIKPSLKKYGEFKDTNIMEINEKDSSIYFKEGQIVNLTKLEFRLFAELVNEPNQVRLYDELTTKIWREGEIKNDMYRLANLIFSIREKLKLANVNSNVIKTIRSRGYMLTD